MKTNKTFALFLAIAAVVPVSAFAADGTITFTGKVTDQTCTINGGTKNVAVALPTVAKGALASVGAVAGRTAFALALTNCSANTKVAAYFEPGSTVDSNGRLINSTATGSATGVGVQLLNNSGTFIPVLGSGTTQSNSPQATTDSAGAATLNYFGEYYANAAVAAGTVSTSVQYTVIYP